MESITLANNHSPLVDMRIMLASQRGIYTGMRMRGEDEFLFGNNGDT